jgi:tetratricopeptide (TPR) repeat protein
VVDRGQLSLLRSARGYLTSRANPDQQAALALRHAEWALEQAQGAIENLESEPLQAMTRLEELRPDLNQAKEAAGDLGVRATLALVRSLAERGMPNERLALLNSLATEDPRRQNSITVGRAQAYYDLLDLDTAYSTLEGVHSPDAGLLRARINRKRGHFSEILTQLSALLDGARLSDLQRAKALVARAGVYARTGKLDEAFDDLRRGESLCTHKRLRKQRISVWMTRASIQAMQGQFAEAEDTLDRLMAEADGRNLERAIEGAHHIYAYVLFERDPAVAAKHLQQSVAISLRTGDAERELTASADLAVARYLTGDIEVASERLEAVMPSLPPLGVEVMAFYTAILALIRIARGRTTSGQAMLARIDNAALGRMLHDENAGAIFLSICQTALDLASDDLDGARRRLALVRGRAIGAPRMVRILFQHFEGLVDDMDATHDHQNIG